MLSRRTTLVLALTLVPAAVRAQGACDQGFLTKPGGSVELTRYNASHVATGKVVTHVDSVYQRGDTTTADVSVDNYLGATKASTTHQSYVCDGHTVSIYTHNTDGLDAFYHQMDSVAKAGGATNILSLTITQPQTYLLPLRVGDTLPAFKTIIMRSMVKALPESHIHGMSADQGWGNTTTITFNWVTEMVDKKLVGGVQMITGNIVVAAAEQCTIPSGTVPCYRITKQLFSNAFSGKSDLEKEPKLFTIGAPMQTITEWFAPGLGVVKLEVDMQGKPIVSLETTAVNP